MLSRRRLSSALSGLREKYVPDAEARRRSERRAVRCIEERLVTAVSFCGRLWEVPGLSEVVIQGGQYRRGDALGLLVENQVVIGGQLDQPLLGRH